MSEVISEISNAIAVPQDPGTGVSETDTDFVSAGHIAGMVASINSNEYIESGIHFEQQSPGTWSISNGLVKLGYTEGIDVQNTDGLYQVNWDEPLSFSVAVPDSTIDVVEGEKSHVYIQMVLDESNKVNIVSNLDGMKPSGPSLKIAIIDDDEGEVIRLNTSPNSVHDSSSVKTEVSEGDSITIPEGFQQIIAEEYVFDGEMDIQGDLSVIGENPTPKRHDHRGNDLIPHTTSVKKEIESWADDVHIKEKYAQTVGDRYSVEGEINIDGSLMVLEQVKAERITVGEQGRLTIL